MPLKTNNTAVMTTYITEVMKKADHHAGSVKDSFLTLCGAVLWAQDDDVMLEIHAIEGQMKNVLWATIGGQRYAFSYNHTERRIEMRKGTTHGPVHAVFHDAQGREVIRQVFEGLLPDEKKVLAA